MINLPAFTEFQTELICRSMQTCLDRDLPTEEVVLGTIAEIVARAKNTTVDEVVKYMSPRCVPIPPFT